ncbi:hypothetical protein [Leptospira santarosai]
MDRALPIPSANQQEIFQSYRNVLHRSIFTTIPSTNRFRSDQKFKSLQG